MRLLLVPTLALLLAAPAAAQKDDDAARKNAERRLRQYRHLDLTESQKKQIVDLFLAENKATKDATETRRAKMKAILNPEQKKKYQDLLDRYYNRGRYKKPKVDPNNRALSWVGLDPNRFASLGLDKEQKAQLDAILTPAAKRLGEQRGKQGKKRWDYEKWRAFALTLRGEIRPQIAKLLSDEQKEKFDAINKKYDDQVKRYYENWLKRRQTEKQRKIARKQGKIFETTAQEIARLMKAATANLGLGEEEAAVIRPLIEQLVRHKVTGTRGLAQRRESVSKAASDADKAREQLAHYRRQGKEYRTKLEKLQGQVRELLTVEQEAQLVAVDLLP